MKYLIFSDTHGSTTDMVDIIRMSGEVNGIIHLGDIVRDAQDISCAFEQIPVFSVRGNNDWYAGEADEKLVLFGKYKMLLLHGHQQGVKHGYSTLQDYAARQNVDAVLFGHTHTPYCDYKDGLWMLNPGSASGKWTEHSTYGSAQLIGGELLLKTHIYR